MNKNSAHIWLPRLVEAGLPTPKTIMVDYDHIKCMPFFDGQQCDEFNRTVEAVKSACKEVGYPVFIRTDLTSAKHEGISAYMAESDADIMRVLASTIEDNEIKLWPYQFPPSAIMVREWLSLDIDFYAFGGHGISREWRFFANDKEVLCFHPYWPEMSIQFYGIQEPSDWKERLKELHKVPLNLPYLKSLAIKAAALFGREASVDIAMDVNGKWWITDMATSEDSYKYLPCENCSKPKESQII